MGFLDLAHEDLYGGFAAQREEGALDGDDRVSRRGIANSAQAAARQDSALEEGFDFLARGVDALEFDRLTQRYVHQ